MKHVPWLGEVLHLGWCWGCFMGVQHKEKMFHVEQLAEFDAVSFADLVDSFTCSGYTIGIEKESSFDVVDIVPTGLFEIDGESAIS